MTLDRKISVMKFSQLPARKEDEADFIRYGWESSGFRWAKVAETGKQNYYSKQGVGAKTAVFTVGKGGGITLKVAFYWKNSWYFVTDVQEAGTVLQEIVTAVVQVHPFVALHTKEEPDELKQPIYEPTPFVAFQAALTEKYQRYTQEEPMARTATMLILVTPKEIELHSGDLVMREGSFIEKQQYFVVRVCHLLGEYRNEYEICREEDV